MIDLDLSEFCQPGSKRHPWCRDPECDCLCHGTHEGAPVAGEVPLEALRAA